MDLHIALGIRFGRGYLEMQAVAGDRVLHLDMILGARQTGTSQAQAREVLTRWQAYQHDSEQISTLVDSGQLDRAVATLTGIARGDAAFDFYYFNDAVTRITAQRRSAFDAALADARSELALWPLVPPATLVVAILLILLGVRPRLAEYR